MYQKNDIFFECFQTVAHNLKKLREKYNLSQEEMAEQLDINRQYYARLERADDPKRRLTLEKVFLACARFGITPNDLITKIPDKEKLPEVIMPKYDATSLQDEISKKMKSMNGRQLAGVNRYMEKISAEKI